MTTVLQIYYRPNEYNYNDDEDDEFQRDTINDRQQTKSAYKL
eukprot:CAMPEP_0184659386 /NCGR_PEP_ID=MMETSP0308-20130426/29395_1 /TAXON_ID=38269 /ORGANISM="Gloeochaete witrockiana, Strain SAG 46.84" /LENGTH=41 /DNA_ID= /DNA_START= /DNA_END= /DNA_ORIENTATION=